MTEIVYADGTTCDPWAQDCPVGKDDEAYSLRVSQLGEQAAIAYGLVTVIAALIPPTFYVSARKSVVDSLTTNSLYQSTW